MSTDDRYAVMDMYADDPDKQLQRSGLAHVGLPVHAEQLNRGVMLVEQPVTGLLLLRASGESASLSKALDAVCGVTLSSRLQSDTQDACCVRWMSPDCWLLSCPLDKAFSIEKALRAEVSGHIAIVNVSGGYSVFQLTGIHARQVLMKSTGYDIHPEHFTQAKVVNTTFAKAQVTMRAIDIADEACYELIVRRSFSDYVWLWLQQAGAEFGLQAVMASS